MKAFDLNLPYRLGPPPVIGTLKSMPSDFVVVEKLGFEPAGAGEHAFLAVTKVGQNTAWVAQQLARIAGVRAMDVNYAGKKDRHAKTTQWFSCWLPGKADPDWSAHGLSGVTIERVTRHTKKIRRGSHAGNRFAIRIREVESAHDAVLKRAWDVAQNGFPNYFGEQRFGRNGGNLEKADALLTGGSGCESRRFNRRDRDIYLSAARGHVFNRALARAIATGEIPAEGWLPGVTRDGEIRGCDDPTFDDWYRGFEAIGVKAMRRANIVIPELLEASFQGDDLTISFDLPNGSYATALLREIVAYNTSFDREEETLG